MDVHWEHPLYLRVSEGDSSSVPSIASPAGSSSIAFIDLDCGTDPLRFLPVVTELPHRLGVVDTVVFRYPRLVDADDAEHEAEIQTWLDEACARIPVLASMRHVAVAVFFPGRKPRLYWRNDRHPENRTDDRVLADCRRAELAALLQAGNGVWQPTSYHYRLPSGQHAPDFVRVADSFRAPRDAMALATWLAADVSAGIGLIVDSGTLTPIVLALHNLMLQNDLALGPVVSLETYPRNHHPYRRSAQRAIGANGTVLGLLSVSSSGASRDMAIDALSTVAPSHWTLHTLVDRKARPVDCRVLTPRRASDLLDADDREENPPSVTWLGLRPALVTHQSNGPCEECRNPARAQIVQIDPRSFEAMALPEPHLVMPDGHDAEDGHVLWDWANETNAIGLDVNPAAAVKNFRAKRLPMNTRLFFERLLEDDDIFAERIEERADEITASRTEATTALHERLNHFRTVHAVVARAEDLDAGFPTPGGSTVDLQRRLTELLAALRINVDGPVVAWAESADLADLVDRRSALSSAVTMKVLVFSWGAVSGLTLRRLRTSVEDALEGSANHEVSALVLHARGPSIEEWESQRNQFRPGDVAAVWRSLLPWTSPLQDERRLLIEYRDSVGEPVPGSFLERRLTFLGYHEEFINEVDDWTPRFARAADGAPAPTALLWGAKPEGAGQDTVRGMSRFGRELELPAVYSAIGSAVHTARSAAQPKAAPRWVMFNMPRAVRSYFDAVIIGCILRWVEPGELWWGATADEESETMEILVSQYAESPAEAAVLLPELLLAAAQGKVPPAAKDMLLLHLFIADTWPVGFSTNRAAVEFGRDLAEWATSPNRS